MRTLLLVGAIGTPMTAEVLKAVHSLPKNTKGRLNVVISSEGGDVQDGFAIYDALRLSGQNIIATVYGAAHSSAALILQAAKYRRMTKCARMLLHEGSVFAEDRASLNETRMAVQEACATHVLYCEILAKRSGLPVETVATMCRNEKYLSADEAVTLGFADEVI